ncbi:MAG: metallophosphoesterase [Candidatus Nitrosocosmicus sp.]|jgi:metallophosphoesterase superfamily enzyme|uniref:metallophosphoesterase n=1 Tax=Candidatus Nitrosocosmicus sp. FF01 TaxID=3397670 RepID=UPI002A720E49|nr:hypothetical protein [Candidatus Nitrosocosmicus sp.]
MIARCVPIYPYPVLSVETSDNRKFLVISDIHIGCEDRIKQAGIYVDPKENVKDLVAILMTVQSKTGIENLIILGDVKSSTNVITRSEWDNVPYFIKNLTSKFNLYIIPGNHDGNLSLLLPVEVKLMLAKGMQLDNILFIHGHTIPKITKNLQKIIAGHLHPILKKEGSILNGKKVWVKIELSKSDANPNNLKGKIVRNIELILIPHFNNLLDFFTSSNKWQQRSNKRSVLPLLDTMLNKQKWIINNAFVYTLDGYLVGTTDDLSTMLY